MNRNLLKYHLIEGQSHMTSHCTGGPVTTQCDFGGVLGRPLDTFFWLSQVHGHGSWLVCEVALTFHIYGSC